MADRDTRPPLSPTAILDDGKDSGSTQGPTIALHEAIAPSELERIENRSTPPRSPRPANASLPPLQTRSQTASENLSPSSAWPQQQMNACLTTAEQDAVVGLPKLTTTVSTTPQPFDVSSAMERLVTAIKLDEDERYEAALEAYQQAMDMLAPVRFSFGVSVERQEYMQKKLSSHIDRMDKVKKALEDGCRPQPRQEFVAPSVPTPKRRDSSRTPPRRRSAQKRDSGQASSRRDSLGKRDAEGPVASSIEQSSDVEMIKAPRAKTKASTPIGRASTPFHGVSNAALVNSFSSRTLRAIQDPSQVPSPNERVLLCQHEMGEHHARKNMDKTSAEMAIQNAPADHFDLYWDARMSISGERAEVWYEGVRSLRRSRQSGQLAFDRSFFGEDEDNDLGEDEDQRQKRSKRKSSDASLDSEEASPRRRSKDERMQDGLRIWKKLTEEEQEAKYERIRVQIEHFHQVIGAFTEFTEAKRNGERGGTSEDHKAAEGIRMLLERPTEDIIQDFHREKTLMQQINEARDRARELNRRGNDPNAATPSARDVPDLEPSRLRQGEKTVLDYRIEALNGRVIEYFVHDGFNNSWRTTSSLMSSQWTPAIEAF